MTSLDDFVAAQDRCYAEVLAQLRNGRKTTHWMWFVFPQVAGLGTSEMSRRFAIESLDQARAYAAHAILGPRLKECARLACAAGGSAYDLFGSPDDLKFHACMTLFGHACRRISLFQENLDRFFAGEQHIETVAILARWSKPGDAG